MRIKNITLGLALLMSGSVLAQHPAHRAGTYVVRDGENDWIIAHRHHLTVPQLHALNPEINWSKLRPGVSLDLAAGRSAHLVATLHPAKKAVSNKHLAALSAKPVRQVPSTRPYVVKDGENDWIIAHRVGITGVALRRANPGLNLTRLRTGQTIRIPATAVARSVNRIHSRYAVVNGDNVNVRGDANTSSDLIAQVDSGTRVVILDRDGEWYKLRFPHGTEGWVRGGLLKAVAAPREVHYAHRRHAHSEYVASRAHSRREYGGYRHRGGSASESWSAADLSENGDAGEKILRKAAQYRGVRYRWGSMSRSATDCSGFTSQVFNSEGFKIPRTSREQSTSGAPVHAKDLKPGDLVFFHTMRGARVTHVGIYVGHGKFIHASSAGGHVQINRLDEGYYQHRLVAARRIVKHKATVTSPKPADSPAPAKKDESSAAPTNPTPGGE